MLNPAAACGAIHSQQGWEEQPESGIALSDSTIPNPIGAYFTISTPIQGNGTIYIQNILFQERLAKARNASDSHREDSNGKMQDPSPQTLWRHDQEEKVPGKEPLSVKNPFQHWKGREEVKETLFYYQAEFKEKGSAEKSSWPPAFPGERTKRQSR